MPELIIDGDRSKLRYLVKIDGRLQQSVIGGGFEPDDYYLQGRAVKALIQLAYANIVDEFLFTDPKGIKYEAISKGNASQVIHQLKLQCPPIAAVILFDHETRRYKLGTGPEDIKFNFSRLKEYPDAEVREMIEDIQRKTGDTNGLA